MRFLLYRFSDGTEISSYAEAIADGRPFETILRDVREMFVPDEQFKRIIAKRFPILAD